MIASLIAAGNDTVFVLNVLCGMLHSKQCTEHTNTHGQSIPKISFIPLDLVVCLVLACFVVCCLLGRYLVSTIVEICVQF